MLVGMSIDQTFLDLERALSTQRTPYLHPPLSAAPVAALAMLASNFLRWFATGFLLGLGLEIAHALGG